MKRLIYILLFSFFVINAKAQSGAPSQVINGWIKNTYTVPDSGTVAPRRDTSWIPTKLGMTITWFHAGSDTAQWFWVGNHWVRNASTVIDTTPLHNQIILKLNISDTAAMLLPYLRKVDTTNKWVQNVYARNDSLFKQKNGTETFVHSFATSGTGTVTSVGLSMPAAFTVSGSPVTTSGTFNVSGAGSSLQYIRGNGTLATFDTTAIPNFYLKARSLLSATSPISYNSTTGVFSLNDVVTAGACTSCNITYNSKGQIIAANTGSANVYANHGLFKEVDTIKFGDSIHNNYNILNYSTGGIAINPSTNTSRVAYIFGTSITYGYLTKLTSPFIDHRYQYSRLFCNYFQLTERNFGIVGQKIIDFDLSTIPHKGDSIKVIVFEFSTNDILEENGTTITYGTFITKYQVMIDTAIARGFSPGDIYMLSAFYFNQNETKANQYNTGIDSLCTLNGTKYINAYSRLRTYGLPGVAAGFCSNLGCHPDSLTHSVTARVIIDTFSYKYRAFANDQRLLVNGMTELDTLRIRNLHTITKDPIIVLGADSAGNVGVLPDNWVILNNKRSRNQLIQYLPFQWNQQVANIAINGEISGGSLSIIDSAAYNFISGRTRFSRDTIPYGYPTIPTNPPQWHTSHVDSTFTVMGLNNSFVDTSYLEYHGWRALDLTQSNLTSALKKTKGAYFDNRAGFNSYNTSSLFFKTIHALDAYQWMYANDSAQLNGVSTGIGGLASILGRLLFRKFSNFSDTTTFIGGTVPNNGPSAMQAVLDMADGSAGATSKNIYRGFFSCLTAGLQTQTHNEPGRIIFINTALHGTIAANTVAGGYGLYINNLGTGFVDKYAIYQEGAGDSSLFLGLVRMPNIAAKADTASYKPVVVDATGNIFKMAGWPTSGGITSLNGLTGSTQLFSTGTSGSDFNISSSSSTHTFNLPDAGSSARGAVTTSSQTFAGQKTFNSGLIAVNQTSSTVIISGNLSSGSDPGIAGIGLKISDYTFTNNQGAGTVSSGQNMNLIGTPTLTSGNAVTYSADVSTMRFSGAPVAAGSTTIDHPYNIFANDVNHFAAVTMSLNEQSAATTLGKASHNIYTGTGDTWTLPALSTWPGLTYFIKNAGSGNLVVQRAGSDNIYNTSSVTSITVAAGSAVIIVAGSGFWYVE